MKQGLFLRVLPLTWNATIREQECRYTIVKGRLNAEHRAVGEDKR